MITVEEFLEETCTEVQANETLAYCELMMDNHKCIEYGGKQYYIPETNFGDEEIIYDFLIDNYSL